MSTLELCLHVTEDETGASWGTAEPRRAPVTGCVGQSLTAAEEVLLKLS